MSLQHPSRQKAFTLLELVIALGLAGVLMAGVWQLSSSGDRETTASLVAGHAVVVARAGNNYLTANNAAVLAQVPAINDVVKIKVTSADSGNGTLTDLQTAGLLPPMFINQNSYGQSYAFYAQRQDAGAAGADASDRLVGLVITTGGNAISDNVGDVVVQRLGAAGGFMYASDNPAPPTAATTARGAGGGWSLNLGGAGWTTTVGATATAGGLAVMTNLLSMAGVTPGFGIKNFDELDDGIANYTRNNLYLGSSVGIVGTTSAANTALGSFIMGTNSTGTNYSMLGIMAGFSAANDANNSAAGSQAYSSNANSSEDVAIGFRALAQFGFPFVTARQTAIGNSALLGNVAITSNTGTNNTAIGLISLTATTSGSSNTVVGNAAMPSNTTGNENVAFGHQALSASARNTQNTAIGAEAMLNYRPTTASSLTAGNVAVGYRAYMGNLLNATTGFNNVAIGAHAYRDGGGSGSVNVAIGHEAIATPTGSFDRTVAIGVQACLACTGNSGFAVAIGKQAAFRGVGYGTVVIGHSALDLTLNTLLTNNSSANVVVGNEAGRGIQGFNGASNVFIGYQAGTAGTAITIGSGNTLIGYQAQSNAHNYANSTALGSQAQITGSSRIVLGNTSITEIRAQVTSITAISDRRLKRDITALPLGLEFIRRLQPVQYRNDNGDEKLRFGFLAQDVKEALPKELQPMAERDIDGLALLSRDRAGGRYYHMAYGELAGVMVQTVKDMDANLAALERMANQSTKESAP